MKQKIPLVFGQGLDRESGVLSGVGDGRTQEAENVTLHEGKFEPRKGMELRSSIPGASYVSLIQALRATHQAVIVLGEGGVGMADHDASVYLASGTATGAILVGKWQDPTLSLEKVRAIGAESGSRVFVAHEEASLPRRAGTIYLDSQDAVPVLHPLVAEWARGGVPENSDAIRFRGVASWGEYLVGWGFWTNAEHRPEAVRISDPGDPTTFQDFAWKLPGQAGDPTVTCVPLDTGLLVYKETELHAVRGSYSQEFEVSLVEKRFGCAAPRLAIEVGGYSYAWSLDGPRRSSGGPSEDIGWPLGLRWPTPADIRASGYLASGIAAYVGQTVLFIFGDLIYVWDIRKEEWSHWRSGIPIHAAGVLYQSGGYQGASRGYPDFSAVDVSGNSVEISWQNISPEGDEAVEVYVRLVGGAWPVAPSGTSLVTSSAQVTLELAEGDYEVAIRYRRQGLYTAGYTGAPDTWPAVSLGTFTVADTPVPAGAPEIANAVWSRTGLAAEQIALTLTLADPAKTTQVWRLSTENPADAVLLTTLAAGTAAYTDPTPAGEVAHKYFARHVSGGVFGAFSPERRIWAGPERPSITSVSSDTITTYGFTFVAGIGEVEHHDNHASADPNVFTQVGEYIPADGGGSGSASPYRNGVMLKLRNKQTLTFGGVDAVDYSEYSPVWAVEVCRDCEEAL